MGQNVEIRNVEEFADVLLIDTDRSFTGQDGVAVTPEALGDGVPALLGKRLFELGAGIDHVFVLQNQLTVRRPGGWDGASRERVTDVTRTFLRHYPDDVTKEEE